MSEYKYWAFISYSSRDRAWARWLHRALETYRLPTKLVTHATAVGEPAPKRFHPLFWDRAELTAHHDLGEIIERSLQASRYLIVICSPNAAQSPWVEKEIQTFIQMHGAARVLAIIVDGNPNARDGTHCFPPTLSLREPKAPDARSEGDGRANAKLMLLATMLGVPFDALKRRDQERKMRLLGASLVVVLSILACMGWLAFEMMLARNSEAAARTLAETKTAEARHALYGTRQQLAVNAWRENRVKEMAEILQQQVPLPGEVDLRGFEWRYLRMLAEAPGPRWQSKGQMINGIAISPDSRTAITVGFDGKATAWDTQKGVPIWDTGDKLRVSVCAAAFSPDGKLIALAGDLGQLQLWNADGTFRAVLKGHRAQVFGVSFSPDGRMLASASADVTARIWDVTSGAALGFLGPDKDVTSLSGDNGFAPDLTKDEDRIGHDNMIWQAQWSPDGSRIATCSTDGSVILWSMPDRRKIRTFTGHTGIAIAVAWSPDGKLLASVSRPLVGEPRGEGMLWNVETGKVAATLHAPRGGFHAVSFLPDGYSLATAGQDGVVRIWNKRGQLLEEHRGFHDEVIALAIGGEGRWALGGTRGGEIVAVTLNAKPGVIATAAESSTCIGFWGDGQLAACSSGTITAREPQSLNLINQWESPAPPEGSTEGRLFCDRSAFAISPQGQTAHGAHGYSGPMHVVWRTRDGQTRHVLEGHTETMVAAAFDGEDLLATADEEGNVFVWSGSTGKVISHHQPWRGPVNFLAFDRQHRLWMGGAPLKDPDEPAHELRNRTEDGRLARMGGSKIEWQTETPSVPRAGAFVPASDTLVVAYADGALSWRETMDFQEVRRRAFGSTSPTSLSFSMKEPRLCAGFSDGSVRVLDSVTGEELLMLEAKRLPVSSVAVSPDGERIAICQDGGMEGDEVVVWHGSHRQSTGIPEPDFAWHKARFEAAAQSDQVFMKHPPDRFAKRFHLERMAKLEPHEIAWPRQLLAMAQDDQNEEHAIVLLQDILRRWPEDAKMWYDLGNSLRDVGRLVDAAEAFKKSIALEGAFPEAHCNLGLVLGRTGNFSEAIRHLTRGNELGQEQSKQGRPWRYPSREWIAMYQRMESLAAKYGKAAEFKDVPASDKDAVIELLMLSGRPLAAASLADAKETSPGPTVIGVALRCAEGLGDAAMLSPEERSTWRKKALAWLRQDWETTTRADPDGQKSMARGIKAHPYLIIARARQPGTWPEEEEIAWKALWDELDTAIRE